MASQDWFEKDFYATLGVPKDADAAAIKKAYRKLARDLHPDHNVGDARPRTRFKEIGEAYSVLSDPEQRREYDAIRAMSHGGARFTRRRPRWRRPASRTSSAAFGGAGGPAAASACASTPAALASPTSRTCSARCSAAARPAASARRSGLRRLRRRPGRAGRRRAGHAPRSASATPSRVDGHPALADLGRITARIPAGGQGRPEDPVCAARGVRATPASPGDLILTVTVAQAPRLRPRRRQPDPRPARHVRRGRARRDRRGADARRRRRSRSRSRRARRPDACCGVKGRGVARGDHTGDLLATVQVAVPQRLSDEAREAVEAYGRGRGRPRPAGRALPARPRLTAYGSDPRDEQRR